MIDKNKVGLIVFSFLVLLFGIAYVNTQSGFNAGTGSSGSGFTGGSSNSFGGSVKGNSFSGSSVYAGSVNPQFSNPGFYTGNGFVSPEVYWPKFNQQDCNERADFIMQIAPGGCSPSVVRSDLLEEQNVPVFCKVMSITTNPMIDISRIRSLHFKGDYPPGVSGISYYPARSVLRSQQTLISSPIDNNIGYVVIVLSRYNTEKEMPEFVGGNITATIDYDVNNAFGIGNTNFYVNELSDEKWLRDYKQYGFWNGKGYIRADIIEPDRATISIYRDSNSKQHTVNLRGGETSREVYLNGFYCAAGMTVRLQSIDAPVDSALLQVNDQQLWVSKGDRILDNKCTVSNLDAYSGGGKISINCPVRNGRIDLSINPGRVNLSVDDGNYKSYAIGDRIEPTKYYVGYSGEDYKRNPFVVVVEDPYSLTYNEFIDKEVYSTIESVISKNTLEISDNDLKQEIKNSVQKQYIRKSKGITRSGIDENIKVCIITSEKSDCGITMGEVIFGKDRIWDLTKETERSAKEYYDKSIKYYEDLFSFYPNEKYIEGSNDESFATMGLYEAGVLSRRYGMNDIAQDYFNRLIRDFPNSNLALKVQRENQLITKYSQSSSRATVNVNSYSYFVELLDFKKPTRADASATLLIDGREMIIGLDEIVMIDTDKNGTKNIRITELKDDYITIQYSRGSFESFYTGTENRNQRLKLGDQTEIEGTRFKLIDVSLKKQAKIQLTPKMKGPRSEANFTFRIGIEKRNLKLSPEQTSDMMDNLKENIKEWERINNKLGEVVKGMKAACYATSAMLTVKNLLSGWSGESLSRTEVMTKSGGWNEYCEKLINDKTTSKMNQQSYADSTVQKCLLDHNEFIEKDIGIYKKQIEKTNKELSDIQKEVGIEKTDILDMNGQVDIRQVEDKYKDKFMEYCKSGSYDSVMLPDIDRTNVSVGSDGMCSWDTLTHDQRREILTLLKTREAIEKEGGSNVLQDMIGKDLGKVSLDAKNYWENDGARKKNEEERLKNNMGIRAGIPGGDTVNYWDIKTITTGDKSHHVYGNYREGESVVLVNVPYSESFTGVDYKADPEVAGKQVTVPIIRQSGGDYIIDPNGSIYFVDGTRVSESGSGSVKNYMGNKGLTRFRENNQKAYENRMTNPRDLMVKYFEREPYKGLPSEVPFDIEDGWYVELTYVLSGFGKPYDESGRVVNFWICNVGPNGMIDFKKSLDDMCRYYNGNTDAPLGFGIEPAKERNLIQKAQQAIYDAQKQYGKERIVINGQGFKSGVSFGGEEGRCSDFMSPSDCNILFNVCDPVMCPASRCDLGGDFRVDNVVQTGIIGSLMLCLPNAKEGIIVPICLSGVHAGIEGYLSILNSTVLCLNESLETGRNIGICDEIKSIYLCEFFWKQATPLINVIIPKIMEGFHNQGVRGGGEYTTVQGAWENMQESINYFRNDYAVNSMAAFQARSTDEIGGEVCKSFMSVRYPNNKDFFDRLIEPDSPIQYHAWFSEDSFTTATIPATSHYKVYWHIYAGKDQGAYYTVYLKDLPDTNYVYSNQVYVLERGYIQRGGQVDKARDFTAVSGYKQLCVNINGQDECGFGKVSSSFLVNSISDSYVEDQKTSGIKSSKECVSGTPSLTTVLNPNVMSGAGELIEPELYNHGIIRICATENPGKRVLPSGEFDTTNSTFDRYKEVGYCDDPTIKCWLDTNSVKDIVINQGIEDEILADVDLNRIGATGYWTEEQSIAVAVQAQKEIENLVISGTDSKDVIENKIRGISKKLEDLSNLGPENRYRARGLYLLANLYKKVALAMLENFKLGMDKTISTLSDEEIEEVLDSTSGNVTTIDIPDYEPEDIPEDIEWTDDKLKENINIEVLKGSATILYKYNSKNKWVSKDSKFNNLKLGYVDGIRKLVMDSGYNDKFIVEGEEIERRWYEVIGGDGRMGEKIFSLLMKSDSEMGLDIQARDVESMDDTSKEETILWTDDLLEENNIIKIESPTITIDYFYSIGRWVSYDQDFVSDQYGYVEGIRKLVLDSNENSESKIYVNKELENTEDIQVYTAEEIFRLFRKLV
ncbi:hypothetical protein GOV12_06275 [Candidatus Pacearchaeota archaeon]|nr:hypothetical protein [Candidatus Pacearchaeota archaeon]